MDFVERSDDHRELPEAAGEHRECAETLKDGIRQALMSTLHIRRLESLSNPDDAHAALQLIQRTLQGQTCRFGNHIFSKNMGCILLLNLLKLLPEPACESVAHTLVDTAAQLAEHLGYQDLSMLHCFLRDCVAALESARERPFKVHVFPTFVQRCKEGGPTGGPGGQGPPGLSLQLGTARRLSVLCSRLARLACLVAVAVAPFASSSDLEGLQVALLQLAFDAAVSWRPEGVATEAHDSAGIVAACLRGTRDLLVEGEGPGSLRRTSLHVQMCALELIPSVAAFALRHCGSEGRSLLLAVTCRALETFDEALLFPRLADMLGAFWAPELSSSCAALGLTALLAVARRFGGREAEFLGRPAEELVRALVSVQDGLSSLPLRPEEHAEVASAVRRLGLDAPLCAHALGLSQQLASTQDGSFLSVCVLSLAVRATPRASDAHGHGSGPRAEVLARFLLEAGALLQRDLPTTAAMPPTAASTHEQALEIVLGTLLEHPEYLPKIQQVSSGFLSRLLQVVVVEAVSPFSWNLFLLAMQAFVVQSVAPLETKFRFFCNLVGRLEGRAVMPPHVEAATWVAISHALVLHLEQRVAGRSPPSAQSAVESEAAQFKRLMEWVLGMLDSASPPHRSMLVAIAYLFPVLLTWAYSVPGLCEAGDRTRMPHLSQVFLPSSPYVCPGVLASLGLPLRPPTNPISVRPVFGQAPVPEPSSDDQEFGTTSSMSVPLPAACCFCNGSTIVRSAPGETPERPGERLPDAPSRSHASFACAACKMAAPHLDWRIFEADPSANRLCLPWAWNRLRRRVGNDASATPGTGQSKPCVWLKCAKELIDVYSKLLRSLLDKSSQNYLSLLEPSDSQEAASKSGAAQRGPPSQDILWLLDCGLFGLCASSCSEQLHERSQVIGHLFQQLLPQSRLLASDWRQGSTPSMLIGLVQSSTFVTSLLKMSGPKDLEQDTPMRMAKRPHTMARQHRQVQRQCHQWRLEVLGVATSSPWAETLASAPEALGASQDVDVVSAAPFASAPVLAPAALRAVLLGGPLDNLMSGALASLLAGAVAARPVGASTLCLQHIISFSVLANLRVDDLFRTVRGNMYHRLFEHYARTNHRVGSLCQLLLRGSLKTQVRALLPKILPVMVLNAHVQTIQELCALLEESAQSLFTPQLPYILSAVAQQPAGKVGLAFKFILEHIYNHQMTLASICDASLGTVLVLVLWNSAAAEGEREASARASAAVNNIVSALTAQGGGSGALATTKAQEFRKRLGGDTTGAAAPAARKRRVGPGGSDAIAIDVVETSAEVTHSLESSFLHVLDILEIVFTGNRQSVKWAEYSPLLYNSSGADDALDYRRLFAAIALLFELVQESLHRYASKILEFLQIATQHSNYHTESVRCWQHYVNFVGVARLKPLLPAVVGELLKLAERLRPHALEACRQLCEHLMCGLVEATCRQHEDLVAFLPSLPAWAELKTARMAVQKKLGAQHGASFATQLAVALPQLESASQQAVRRAALSHISDLVSSQQRGANPRCIAAQLDTPLLASLMRALFKFLWESSAFPADQLKCGELLGQIGAVDPSRFSNVDMGRGLATQTPSDLGNIELLAKRVLVDFLAPNLTSKNSYAFAVQEILKYLQDSGQADRVLGSLTDEVRETLKPYLHSSYQLIEADDKAQARGATSIAKRYEDPTSFEGVVAQAVSMVQGKQQALFEACLPAVQGNHALALFLMHHVLHDILTSSTPLNELGLLSESLASLLSSPKHETAQAVFSLVDDMIQRRDSTQWDVTVTRAVDAKARDRMLQRIDQMRKPITNRKIVAASVRCGAHARALQFLEEAVLDEYNGNVVNPFDCPRIDKEDDCFLLQSIYRDLDEPDGVLGSLRIGPVTVMTRTLQLEQAARWHDAQACYEEQLSSLAGAPAGDEERQDLVCGLVRCNQNMRRFESALRLIQGAGDDEGLRAKLRPTACEAAWQLSSWDRLGEALAMPEQGSDDCDDFQVSLGKSLLALHKKDPESLKTHVSETMLQVTRTVASAARESYTRAYQHLLKLHVLSDIAWLSSCRDGSSAAPQKMAPMILARSATTAPTFVARQTVLSPLRVALVELNLMEDAMQVELEFIKLSRKHSVPIVMEHPSTSFCHAPPELQLRAQLEWGKLMYSRGFRDDALQHMMQLGMQHPRARLLGARWATEAASELLVPKVAEAEFAEVKDKLPEDEAAWFYHASYLDQLLKEQIAAKGRPSAAKGRSPGSASVCPFDMCKLVTFTVRGYLQALHRGNKRLQFILNRVLQLAWDCSELDLHKAEVIAEIDKQAQTMQPWMWYMVLPQLISRVHNTDMRQLFTNLIMCVLCKYPHQAFWHIVQLMKSTNKEHSKLGMNMVQEVARQDNAAHRIMCTYHVVMQDLSNLATSNPPDGGSTMSLSKSFPKLLGGGGSSRPGHSWKVLVPLQRQMTAAVPRMRSQKETQVSIDAFPEMLFSERCLDSLEVFRTKERPKKLVFLGNDGREYPFLVKAERRGDLRKDSRMMMFGTMVNQLLDQNPDARRRNLCLVTFNVVILQESCGLIEWVSKTRGMRHIIDDLWKRLRPGHQQTVREIKDIFDHSKDLHETFTKQVLPRHPPVLHKWFMQCTDPSVWLSKRLIFARSQALWCMLGYIVGLGDRHGENILLDTESGRMVHVDFDCLFGKGMLLERPETVPFRLTQNCVAAMGVTGIEGVFRRSCELCMGVLRDRSNKQTLLSVLHVYIADPLIEWTGRQHKDQRHEEEFGIQQARNTIGDVEKKLNGMLNVGAVVILGARREAESVLSPAERGRGLLGRDRGVGLSVAGQVDELLKAAMCKRNLSEMYVGWQPWV